MRHLENCGSGITKTTAGIIKKTREKKNLHFVFSSGNVAISFQSTRQYFRTPLCHCGGASAALLEGHVGPAEAASRQQHVPDQSLDGGFPHQPDEEKLLDDGRRDGAEGRQAKQELPEPVRLVGILTPHIFLQSTLGFLLQTLHVGHVRQSTGICKGREGADRTSAK